MAAIFIMKSDQKSSDAGRVVHTHPNGMGAVVIALQLSAGPGSRFMHSAPGAGDRYEGEFSEGMVNSRGIYTWANGMSRGSFGTECWS